LPRYTFTHTTSGETRTLSDPGRGLISGRWIDLGRFKVPGLRGLAGHPPYFHDGSASTLDEVIGFFSRRFQIQLSDQERADLVAFLSAL
jgi:cytochrome c peroxidase